MKSTNSRFSVTYHTTPNKGESAESLAKDIAIEQTVEVPEDCIPAGFHEQGLIGQIEEIGPIAGKQGKHEVTISYRNDITAHSVPQFLNVLFGNISLKNNIRITGISFSEELEQAFSGPGHGIPGIRNILGIYDRPLACIALKPMGLGPEQLAARVAEYTRGGVDLIKDDHGIGNQHFCRFKDRVSLCQSAVEHNIKGTGRITLYFPMVSGKFDELEEQVRFAARQGVRGVLIAPMLVGPDTMRYLSEQYGLIIMGHPALTGTHFHDRNHGISPAVLLGTLFRMMGADISIFPNAGGRFHFSEEECRELASALQTPSPTWKPAFPCPAGGMHLNRVDEMVQQFGNDIVLLIGGSVMQQGRDLAKNTRLFMDRIRSCTHERLEPPNTSSLSSCDLPGDHPSTSIREILKFQDYRWSEREPDAYKEENGNDFRKIVRQELTGKNGESTSFDLRYFEIGPGGYSSLECHHHEHVIIGVRGKGTLLKGPKTIEISPHDIAYIAPMEKHQLRNYGKEPFGFYCIVDHERDRPVKV